MRVEGISNYYAFMYNMDTGKILADNEAADGFADYYNQGAGENNIINSSYSARKSGIDNLIRFLNMSGTKESFFNPAGDSDNRTIVEERVSDIETRYYVDGSLVLTSLAGEISTDIKIAQGSTGDASGEEETVFNDVYSFSISDAGEEVEEGHVSPKRKTGSYSQVFTAPDGTRYLVITMYLCGKEIKITKKLPPLDEKDEEDDSLLRQDNDEEDEAVVMKAPDEDKIAEEAPDESLLYGSAPGEEAAEGEMYDDSPFSGRITDKELDLVSLLFEDNSGSL